MMKRHTPPGFTSIARTVLVKPFGPHQFAMCLGSVHIFQTRSRGASTVRVKTMVASPGATMPLLFSATFFPFQLESLQIIIEAVEALVPEPAIVLKPGVDADECFRFDSARPPLRFAAAADEPGMLEHLEVLGHGRKAHIERLRQFADRRFAERQSRQDRAPSRVGEG